MGLAWRGLPRDVPLGGHRAPRPGGRRHEPKAGTGPPGWWGVLGGPDLCGCPLGSPLPWVGAQRGRVAPTASSGLLPPLLQNLPPDPIPALLHPSRTPPSPQTPPGIPSALLLWGQALSTAPFPLHPPLAAASTHGCSRAGGLLAPQVLLGTGCPGGRGAAGTHRSTHADRTGTGTCLGRGRHHVSSRGSGWARGTRGRGRAAPWGRQGASRRMGTRCGEQGAGDTQGCWGHPGVQASSGNRGVPRGRGLGAQGCRRHGSCLETRPDPGPSGAPG